MRPRQGGIGIGIRVTHLGTGNVGAMALRHLIEDPRFDLISVWVSTQAKVGKDAGALAGLDSTTGVRATGSLEELIGAGPDCAVYCAMGDVRLLEAIDDVRRLLAAGINVVGTAPGSLMYPWHVLPEEMISPVEQAARDGGVSLFVNGVDPGFVGDVLPLVLAGTCRTVHQVRVQELADYATYDGVPVMREVMGFGQPLDQTPMLLQPGVLGAAWGGTIHQLAAGLGVEVDRIDERYEREPAEHDLDVASGRIEAGTQAGLWFEISGMVGDHPAIVVEHATRLFEGQRPDWPRPAQPGGSYRVEIAGEPSYRLDLCPTSADGDHNDAAILVGAGRVVNAIPALVAAEPGIRTTLDLGLVTGPGLTVPGA